MGDRVPGPLCGERLGPDWIDAGTLCRSRSSSPGPTGRQGAKTLKAADARTVLQASLPFVLDHMTGQQVQQMQRALDAAVVNPNVRSKPIRLDFEALLTPEALQAKTDNPDEAAYLETVRQTLATRGVWLRFAPKLVRDPEDPSRHVIDARTFEAWLSLGPDGETIPTESGRLTRDALLGTTLLGAGYYRRVHQGAEQSALDTEIRRLVGQIETGLTEHQRLVKRREDAFVGVAEISDALGGADLPDRSIWDQPRQFVLRAMDLNVGGNIKGSQAFLVTAAILTRNAGQLLADYIAASSAGAQKAVAVLKVVKTAGEVAEFGLAVTGVVGVVRRAAGAAGASAATGGSVDAAAERVVRQYVAENPAIAGDLARVRWVPGPKGSVGGGVKPGSSAGAGTGWSKWP